MAAFLDYDTPPQRSSNLRSFLVGPESKKLLPASKWRRGIFVQNPSTSDLIRLTNTNGDEVGLIVGQTGSLVSDMDVSQEIWAANITGTAAVTVNVWEFIGFDVFEFAMFQQNKMMIELLSAIERKL